MKMEMIYTNSLREPFTDCLLLATRKKTKCNKNSNIPRVIESQNPSDSVNKEKKKEDLWNLSLRRMLNLFSSHYIDGGAIGLHSYKTKMAVPLKNRAQTRRICGERERGDRHELTSHFKQTVNVHNLITGPQE